MRSTLTFPTLLLTFATSAQWELVTPIKTLSEFDAIQMVSDNVAFAVDWNRGAILRTYDAGVNWERMANGLTNNPMALHMWDAERGIVVGENGSVYRTTDAFETITTSNNPTFGHLRCVFFLNDTLGWVGTESGKIYRSVNGGATWTLMASGQPTTNYITAIQFVDTQVGYASCYAGEMLKSTDGGLTWQGVGPFDQLVLMRDLHFYDALTGVAVGSAGEVIRTTDGGLTWDSIPSNTTYTMEDLSVSGNTMVACGANGRVIRSTDAGLTWNAAQVGLVEHQSVSLLPSGVGLLGTNGRIQRTQDSGQTWSVVHTGTLTSNLNKMSFANDQVGVTVGFTSTGSSDSGMLRTIDGGRHWQAATGGGGIGVHIQPNGFGSRGGSVGGFARTNDLFATSTPIAGPNMAIRSTWTLDANTHIVAGGYVNGCIYRTTNNGTSWTQVMAENISVYDLWFASPTLGFAVGESGVSYRTTDGGATWAPMTETMANDQFTVYFLNEQLGWMGGATCGARTTDGGLTWQPMCNIPSYTKSIFFTDADTGYAVGQSAQTLRTTDGGLTWATILPDMVNVTVNDAAWVDGTIVIGCNGGDIYVARIACPQEAEVPVVTQSGGTLCTNTSGTVQWFFNGDALPEGTTPCIEPTQTGNYHVVVTDPLGCISAPSAAVQVISTSQFENEANNLQLAPNPVNNHLHLTWSDGEDAVVVVSDIHGRVVMNEVLRGAQRMLDVTSLEPGVHIVWLSTSSGVHRARFVKVGP